MEETTNKKSNKKSADRISITSENSSRIETWIDQLRHSVPGISVTKSDLVNWMFSIYPEQLSSKDVLSIRDLFFDEVAFAEWALRTVKEGKARGEVIKLSDLFLNRNETFKTEKKARKKQSISDEVSLVTK